MYLVKYEPQKLHLFSKRLTDSHTNSAAAVAQQYLLCKSSIPETTLHRGYENVAKHAATSNVPAGQKAEELQRRMYTPGIANHRPMRDSYVLAYQKHATLIELWQCEHKALPR